MVIFLGHINKKNVTHFILPRSVEDVSCFSFSCLRQIHLLNNTEGKSFYVDQTSVLIYLRG